MALLIFVDESGGPLQLGEGPYVVSSVTVHEDYLGTVDSVFSHFISHISNTYGIQISEIHTKYLVKGNSPWRLSIKDRAKVFSRYS